MSDEIAHLGCIRSSIRADPRPEISFKAELMSYLPDVLKVMRRSEGTNPGCIRNNDAETLRDLAYADIDSGVGVLSVFVWTNIESVKLADHSGNGDGSFERSQISSSVVREGSNLTHCVANTSELS